MKYTSTQIDSIAKSIGESYESTRAALVEEGHSVEMADAPGAAPGPMSSPGRFYTKRLGNRELAASTMPSLLGAAGLFVPPIKVGQMAMPVLSGLARAGISGLGGAAGGAAEQAMQGVQPTGGHMAMRGAEQFIGSGLGDLAMQAPGLVARGTMENALRPGPAQVRPWRTMRSRTAQKPFAEEVPADAVDAALEEGITVGKSPEFPGIAKTERLRDESAAEAKGILGWMDRSRSSASPKLRANTILDRVWKLKEEQAFTSDPVGNAEAVEEMVKKFQKGWRSQSGRGWKDMTIDELNKVKQQAQRAADTYKGKGVQLDEKNALRKRFNEALAADAQRALEAEYERLATMLGKPSGELAASNARTGRMQMLSEVVRRAEEAPPLPPMSAGETWANIPLLFAPRMMKHRTGQSMIANAAYGMRPKGMMDRLLRLGAPRAGALTIDQLMREDQER